MAKQIINIGSAELAGDGETIRAAFAKINDNFGELYGNLQTIIPLPNVSGQYLSTDGTNIFWNDLPSTNQLINGENNLTLESNGTITVNGDTYQPGIIVSNTPPVTATTGKLWYDTESGRMFVYYDSFWVDANPRGNISSVSQGTKVVNAVGNPGDISYDTDWVYICVATNTWKRAPLSGGY